MTTVYAYVGKGAVFDRIGAPMTAEGDPTTLECALGFECIRLPVSQVDQKPLPVPTIRKSRADGYWLELGPVNGKSFSCNITDAIGRSYGVPIADAYAEDVDEKNRENLRQKINDLKIQLAILGGAHDCSSNSETVRACASGMNEIVERIKELEGQFEKCK